MHFFTLDSSKIEVIKPYFFDIVITQNDHPRYVKHVLGSIYVFSPYLGIFFWGGVSQGIGTQPAYAVFHLIWVLGGGGGGGSPKGLVHNLLMPLFTLGSSKMEVVETYFFDIVITQNDHPRYVKHVLGHIYVFLTLFG